MAAWGSGRDGPSCVAYVVRNAEFDMLIKIARELFTRSEHRTFTKLEEALAWLDSLD